jgi:hypothetical protein
MTRPGPIQDGTPDEIIEQAREAYEPSTAAVLQRVIKGDIKRVKHHNAMSKTVGVPGKGSGIIPAARTKATRAAAFRRSRRYP